MSPRCAWLASAGEAVDYCGLICAQYIDITSLMYGTAFGMLTSQRTYS